MPEPHSTAAGAAIGAATSAPLILFGAHVDALVLGLAAAISVVIWLESIDNKLKAASAVVFSALLAGFGSPAAADLAISKLPALSGTGDSLRLLMAFAIGGAAPYVVPLLMRRIGKKADEVQL